MINNTHSFKEKLCMWIAKKLPDWLIYWSSARLVAFALTGKYEDTDIADLSAIEALERWEKDHRKNES